MKNLIITGKIISNPEIFTDTEDCQFINFKVNTTELTPKYHSEVINIVTSDKLAEFARVYLKKGNKVLVEGVPIADGFISQINLYAKNIEPIEN